MAAVSSTTNQQDMNQTPSPSDSAVGDLETMLKEKDTEINYLRETMEQNEQVIFKVRTEQKLKAFSRTIWDKKTLFHAFMNSRNRFLFALRFEKTIQLQYGFNKNSLRKNETLTS